eukprot:TRINITY_DN6026_c0_g1_i12.p2 TRINITY_DN6026_c0_g1~~TRINITY_DN6026_c0_g1_i12.p2  ORF type:complete len:578 (-),score=126.45 TRINITY_DN6026_c0_g1_i12:1900-3489(-)
MTAFSFTPFFLGNSIACTISTHSFRIAPLTKSDLESAERAIASAKGDLFPRVLIAPSGIPGRLITSFKGLDRIALQKIEAWKTTHELELPSSSWDPLEPQSLLVVSVAVGRKIINCPISTVFAVIPARLPAYIHAQRLWQGLYPESELSKEDVRVPPELMRLLQLVRSGQLDPNSAATPTSHPPALSISYSLPDLSMMAKRVKTSESPKAELAEVKSPETQANMTARSSTPPSIVKENLSENPMAFGKKLDEENPFSIMEVTDEDFEFFGPNATPVPQTAPLTGTSQISANDTPDQLAVPTSTQVLFDGENGLVSAPNLTPADANMPQYHAQETVERSKAMLCPAMYQPIQLEMSPYQPGQLPSYIRQETINSTASTKQNGPDAEVPLLKHEQPQGLQCVGNPTYDSDDSDSSSETSSRRNTQAGKKTPQSPGGAQVLSLLDPELDGGILQPILQDLEENKILDSHALFSYTSGCQPAFPTADRLNPHRGHKPGIEITDDVADYITSMANSNFDNHVDFFLERINHLRI